MTEMEMLKELRTVVASIAGQARREQGGGEGRDPRGAGQHDQGTVRGIPRPGEAMTAPACARWEGPR